MMKADVLGATWETNHLLLFKASADWIKNNSIENRSRGELKIGYQVADKRKEEIK
jgi:hypothetical protein